MVQNPPPEVGNMVDELNMLSLKIKPTQIQQESSPLPTVQKEVMQAPISQPLSEPAKEQTSPLKSAKNKPCPIEHISFDKAVTRVLEQKMKQIDEEAAAKKREVEDRFYSKLYSFIDAIDTSSPPPANNLPQQPPQVSVAQPQSATKSKPKSGYVYPMKFKVFLIVAIIISSLLIGGILTHAFGTLQSSQQVSNSGVMASTGLGVYSNSAATKNCTTIDWGITYPGSTVARYGYLKNLGNIPMNVSLVASAFAPPEAAQYLSVSWDAQYKIIQPNDILPMTLTLAVSPNSGSLSSFSFNIQVIGVQLPQ
jgi:hypothetical protein